MTIGWKKLGQSILFLHTCHDLFGLEKFVPLHSYARDLRATKQLKNNITIKLLNEEMLLSKLFFNKGLL